MVLAAVEAVAEPDPVGAAARHQADLAAEAAAGESIHFVTLCKALGRSALEGLLYGGDIDPAHRHHRLEGAPGRRAVGAGDGFAENTRGDLPGDAPFVAAPAAGAFLAAIVDDGVPQAVGLGLVVGGDLEGERFAVAEGRAAVEAEAGMPITRNSTVSTSPSLPEG